MINKKQSSNPGIIYSSITLKFYDSDGNLIKESFVNSDNLSYGLNWVYFPLNIYIKPFKNYYFTISSPNSSVGSYIVMFGVDYNNKDGFYKLEDPYYYDGSEWFSKDNSLWGADFAFKVYSKCYNKKKENSVFFYYGWLNITGGYYKLDKESISLYDIFIVADKNKESLSKIKNVTNTFLYYPLGSSYGNSSDVNNWKNNVINFINEYSDYVGGFFFDEVDPDYFNGKDIDFFNNSLKEFIELIHNKSLKVIINGRRFYADYGDYYLWESFIRDSNYKILNFFSDSVSSWESNYDKYLYLKNKNLLNKTIVLVYGLENETNLAIYYYLLSKALGFNKFAYANSKHFSSEQPPLLKFTFYNYFNNFNNNLNSLVVNGKGIWVLGKKLYFYDLNESYNVQKLIVKEYNYSNFFVSDGLLWLADSVLVGFKNPKPSGSNLLNVKKLVSLSNDQKDVYEIKTNLSFDYALVKIPVKNYNVVYVKKCSVYDSSYHCLGSWENLSFKLENDYVVTNVTSFSIFVVGYNLVTENKNKREIEASFFIIPELAKCLFKKLISFFN